MKNRILLFIPIYNCERQIVRVLGQLTKEVQNYISEVIIINNRSTDNGEQVVIDYLNCHSFDIKISLLRNNENYGLGGSHKVAFNYAIDNGFDYVIVLHGDDQGNINDLIYHIKDKNALKFDSFLGARFHKESKLVNYSKFRIFGNYIFNIFISICARKKLIDLGSGLNMYKVSYLSDRFYIPFVNSLTFNVYMLLYGVYSKSNFTFFPLTWREDDQISNAKFFKQAIEIFKVSMMFVFTKFNNLNKNVEFSKINYSYMVVFSK